MGLLTRTEVEFFNGTREFTKPQERYIRCRLKKKLRLLDNELQLAECIRSDSVAANCSGNVAAGCNGPDKLLGQPGRALAWNEIDKKEGSLGRALVPRPLPLEDLG
jgi:hypothetical protein